MLLLPGHHRRDLDRPLASWKAMLSVRFGQLLGWWSSVPPVIAWRPLRPACRRAFVPLHSGRLVSVRPTSSWLVWWRWHAVQSALSSVLRVFLLWIFSVLSASRLEWTPKALPLPCPIVPHCFAPLPECFPYRCRPVLPPERMGRPIASVPGTVSCPFSPPPQ